MNSPLKNNLRIFWALTRRDTKIILSSFKDQLINRGIFLSFQILVFGYLFPHMGMSPDLIVPLCIGDIFLTTCIFFYSLSIPQAFDLKFSQYINFQLSLPLPKQWLFAQYVFKSMLEVSLTTLPLIASTLLLLGQTKVFSLINLPIFLFMYVCSLMTLATLFLTCCFSLHLDWYLANTWPRILTPLLFFSCMSLPWCRIYSFWPLLGIISLFNPFTYIGESWRATLSDSPGHLPLWFCTIMLFLWTALLTRIAYTTISRRLDPV